MLNHIVEYKETKLQSLLNTAGESLLKGFLSQLRYNWLDKRLMSFKEGSHQLSCGILQIKLIPSFFLEHVQIFLVQCRVFILLLILLILQIIDFIKASQRLFDNLEALFSDDMNLLLRKVALLQLQYNVFVHADLGNEHFCLGFLFHSRIYIGLELACQSDKVLTKSVLQLIAFDEVWQRGSSCLTDRVIRLKLSQSHHYLAGLLNVVVERHA